MQAATQLLLRARLLRPMPVVSFLMYRLHYQVGADSWQVGQMLVWRLTASCISGDRVTLASATGNFLSSTDHSSALKGGASGSGQVGVQEYAGKANLVGVKSTILIVAIGLCSYKRILKPSISSCCES